MSEEKADQIADDIAGRFADALRDDDLARRLLGQSASAIERSEPGNEAVVFVTLADSDKLQISFDAYPKDGIS